MQSKDFTSWTNLKEKIDEKVLKVRFSEREIWWCNLGVNIGFEQDGKGDEFLRPVLIYKKHNAKIMTVLPLSTKIKTDNPFYQIFTFRGREQSAIIAQVRTVDARRLVNKMGEISNLQFDIIKTRFKEIYG